MHFKNHLKPSSLISQTHNFLINESNLLLQKTIAQILTQHYTTQLIITLSV